MSDIYYWFHTVFKFHKCVLPPWNLDLSLNLDQQTWDGNLFAEAALEKIDSMTDLEPMGPHHISKPLRLVDIVCKF